MTQAQTASRGTTVPAASSPVAAFSPAPFTTSGGGSSGLSVAGQSVRAFRAPRVTFGDGRSPGLLSGRPDDLPSAVTPASGIAEAVQAPLAPAPQPVPEASEPTAVPIRIPLQGNVWLPDTPVTSLWGQAEPSWPAGVIFGVAGLILAPIGGIWLGRRQARASNVVSQFVER